MKLENLKKPSDEVFRRITGVQRTTFETMIRILQEALILKRAKGAGPIN
ncbi:hypothetical protein H0W26_06250 [Candidatus Dependentiae bacterium]|nr:hypothetical protein [Candidatus Dependentiae bacterium]